MLNLGNFSKESLLSVVEEKFPSSLCKKENQTFSGFISEYGFLYLIRIAAPQKSSDALVLQIWYETQDKPDCPSRHPDLDMKDFEFWFQENLVQKNHLEKTK